MLEPSEHQHSRVPPVPAFTIETSASGAQATIRVIGELDSAAVETLLEHHARAAGGSSDSRLVIDLRQVTFIDSAGIRAMVLLQRGAAERGGALAVLEPPRAVLELLELAGLAERLTVASEPAAPFDDLSFTLQRELNLAPDPSAPAHARAYVRQLLADRADKPGLDALALLTSELVTNAVVHPEHLAGDLIGLRITAYEHRMRVEVSDSGAGFDPARLPTTAAASPPTRPEPGGRGLLLVEAIASRWGTRRRDPGGQFMVWFELDGAGSPTRAAARA